MKNNSPFHRVAPVRPRSRREFLWQSGGGLGGIALASLLAADKSFFGEVAAANPHSAFRLPHFPPKAKRVVQLFMAGAASHLDLFDFKPELVKRDGQASDFGESVEAFQNGLGPWKKPVWDFRAYGQSGKMLSDAVADLGSVADELAFIHNLVGKTGIHSQATLLQATGFNLPGFPGMGSWVSYGLGTENENLPTFVVLPDHRGLASNGTKNWDAAFLPQQHSGTVIYPGTETPIADLFPHKQGTFVTRDSEAAAHAVMVKLNQAHAASREGDGRLESRIRSYELAARMQLAAPEALDISREPDYLLRAYGINNSVKAWPKEINAEEEADIFGRKCLVARRLLERGVRFVQIWSGNDNGFPRRNWDSHEDIERDHGPLARGMARGAAALIQDLKQRGLLEDTIILWTTEFGRMPSTQGGKGRDHNPFVFTNWLCGGGIKRGVTHGESDQWGYKPLNRNAPTTCYDIHATMLHLLGIHHEQLTFRNNGIDRRLTDVHGEVIKELLA
ncbi:MAG: sulfatase [Pedosphaera sp. Tous-C6FEB]|nr:MAG: sulfatase [Pedosphaera sp. Tous-C6FEB]